VAVLAFFFGPLTGASMNPARTLGPNLPSGAGGLFLYTLSTTAGALAAAAVTRWKSGPVS
ncbi:MAG: aquaporin, partial [Candidatus Poseidoniaceae archaeon]